MEFKLDTHPGRTLHLFLFCDVQNSKDLLNLMQTGMLEPELAFLNASLAGKVNWIIACDGCKMAAALPNQTSSSLNPVHVPDAFPVLAAAHKALVSLAGGKIRTRTIHSELIYNYAGSKHIRESLLRCGITDSTSYILVGRLDALPEHLDAVRRLMQGTQLDLSELPKRVDQELIKKHYKISSAELDNSSLEDAITCHIAARDAL